MERYLKLIVLNIAVFCSFHTFECKPAGDISQILYNDQKAKSERRQKHTMLYWAMFWNNVPNVEAILKDYKISKRKKAALLNFAKENLEKCKRVALANKMSFKDKLGCFFNLSKIGFSSIVLGFGVKVFHDPKQIVHINGRKNLNFTDKEIFGRRYVFALPLIITSILAMIYSGQDTETIYKETPSAKKSFEDASKIYELIQAMPEK